MKASMKYIGAFSEARQREALHANGRAFWTTWESEPGFVEVPGLTEYRVRVDDDAGKAVVFMRWLTADIGIAGGPEGVLEALESHSGEGEDWAACLRQNREQCPPAGMQTGAIALLALIASTPEYLGQGLGITLARFFAEQVLAARGVRAFWLQPVPLEKHAKSGLFKPRYERDSAAFRQASKRLERYYERSLDAKWTCPDYLRVDLVAPEA